MYMYHVSIGTLDILSLQLDSSFMTAWALSRASLSACSRMALCSVRLRASQRMFDSCTRTRVKSSSETSGTEVDEEEEDVGVMGTQSSDFGARTEDTSLTSRKIEERNSFFLRLSMLVVSRSLSSSCSR